MSLSPNTGKKKVWFNGVNSVGSGLSHSRSRSKSSKKKERVASLSSGSSESNYRKRMEERQREIDSYQKRRQSAFSSIEIKQKYEDYQR